MIEPEALHMRASPDEQREVWEAPYVVSCAVRDTAKPNSSDETDDIPTHGPS